MTEAFGETEAGRWLAENASKFGFIIRYVGVAHASAMADRGLTLEEYLNELG